MLQLPTVHLHHWWPVDEHLYAVIDSLVQPLTIPGYDSPPCSRHYVMQGIWSQQDIRYNGNNYIIVSVHSYRTTMQWQCKWYDVVRVITICQKLTATCLTFYLQKLYKLKTPKEQNSIKRFTLFSTLANMVVAYWGRGWSGTWGRA